MSRAIVLPPSHAAVSASVPAGAEAVPVPAVPPVLDTPAPARTPAGRPTRRAIAPVPLDQLPDVMGDEHVRLALGLTKAQWERHITNCNRKGGFYTLPVRIPVGPRRYLKVDVAEWMRSGATRVFRRRSA